MHCVLQTVTRHVRVAATRSQLSVRVGCGDGKKGSPHFGSERLPSAARGATKINSGLILSSMRVELMEVVSDQYHKIPFGMVSSTTPPFGLAFLIAG